MLIYSSL